MADTIASSSSIQLEFAFVDGDTRLTNVNNAKDSVTSAQIAELNTYIRANNLIVGDKNGGTFAQINYAKRINKTTTTLDINQ